MTIIPVINCQDFEAVRERFAQIDEILFGAGGENRVLGQHEEWVHIDVADGSFTGGYQTWRLPEQLNEVRRRPELKIEVHLMVNNPAEIIEKWIAARVNRIIVHLETTGNLPALADVCKESGIEIWLSLAPQTPAEHAKEYLSLVDGCQVLAVPPGLSGQELAAGSLQKIKALHAAAPHLPLEVDGGVNLQTIPALKVAGASQAVSGSFLFQSDNPAHAYQQLADLAQ